jgi:hypothetical protein
MRTKDGDTLTVETTGGGTLTFVADSRVPVGTFVVVNEVNPGAWRSVIAKGLAGSPGIIYTNMVAR